MLKINKMEHSVTENFQVLSAAIESIMLLIKGK